MRNKETALGAMSQKKKGMGSGSHQHLEVDPKWNGLNKKEKQFCIDLNMKPTSYCTLKRDIQFEVAKNRKVSNQFLTTLQVKNKNVPQAARAQIPAIY